MQFIVKVAKLNRSRIITLPKLLADYCGFNRGSSVMIITNPDRTATIINNDELNKRVANKNFDSVWERIEHG